MKTPDHRGNRRRERNHTLREFSRLIFLVAIAATALWTYHDLPEGIKRFRERSRSTKAPAKPLSTEIGKIRALEQDRAPAARHLPPVEPLHHPGSSWSMDLSEPPEKQYGELEESGADELYRRLLNDLGRSDAEYDANLARAARELAYQYSLDGQYPPPDAIEFLVHASGAIDSNLSSRITRTGAEDQKVLSESLERALKSHAPGDQTLRVGMGEIFIPGSRLERYVAILASRRSAEIEASPRSVSFGEPWSLEGYLDARFSKLGARVLYPSGLLEDVPVARSDERFKIEVDTSLESGALIVEISANGPSGPGKVLQVPLYVEEALPDFFETILPPDESHIAGAEAAEKHAFRLLNKDRARAQLPPLIWDEDLRAIARPHSEDMRDNQFFGHLSPTTGLVSDRVKGADYAALTFGENLAHHGSLYAAQHALMRSLGHRINILNPEFTHVGTGIAIRGSGDDRRWYLTQVFATPPSRINPKEAIQGILSRIDRSRSELDLAELKVDRNLSRAARIVAQLLVEGSEEATPRSALDQADEFGALRGRSNASTALVSKPENFQIPAVIEREEAKRLGIGVAQESLIEGGKVGIVFLLSE